MNSGFTGVRACIALWIFLGHSTFASYYGAGFGDKVDWGVLSSLVLYRIIGVDAFFVLSGFVMFYSYHHVFTGSYTGKMADKFYLIRLARIYPVHILTLGVIALYHYSGVPHPIGSGTQDRLFEYVGVTLFLNLTLTTSWGIFPVASWNEPAWSISALMIVYLMFPTLAYMLRHTMRNGILWLLLLSCFIVQMAVYTGLEGVSGSDGAGALVRVLTDFLAGCFAYKLYQNGVWEKRNSDLILTVVLLSLLAGIYAQYYIAQWFHFSLLSISFPLMYIALMRATGRVQRVLSSKVMVFLGRISFCIYMLQYPVLIGLGHVYGNELSALASSSVIMPYLLLLGAGMLLVLISWLVTKYIEIPCYRFVKKRFPVQAERTVSAEKT